MLGDPELVPRKGDLRRFASSALDLGLKAVFITLGEEGVFVVDSSGERRIAAPSGQAVVDTTGCGDVFHGAYAACVAKGETVHTAVQVATATAALKATKPGGRAGIPDRPSVDRFLAAKGVSQAAEE